MFPFIFFHLDLINIYNGKHKVLLSTALLAVPKTEKPPAYLEREHVL